MRRILTAIVFLCVGLCLNASTLFSNKTTDYTIVVAQNASVSEKTAASELQLYLNKISGAQFKLTNNLQTRGKRIFVGYNSKVAEILKATKPEAADESFTYKSLGDDIFIFGGSQRGTMYGVYSFLENELGVRWLTAECTKIPSIKSWSFTALDHSEKPFISYRYTMYYRCADDRHWAAHNKNNFHWATQKNEYGGMEACLGAHSLEELIPADEFFKKNPEFFALRNGKREAKAQRCLSNKKMLEIVKRRVIEKIEKNPDYLYYDVSQLDNELFCECQECRKIENLYGGRHSGLMLWFVNQIAEAVAKKFPQKKISTFAYQYSRQAPKNIKPRENVIIRLCDFECCFAHPLESCPENESFMKDLKEWSQLTKNLFIWDYVVNFGHYLAPYPNFGVLAENIKTFGENGATIVLEQGQRQSYGGEFGDMKAWVLAKLLWNPHQDVKKLTSEFIKDYYGPAAKDIQKYFDLCQSSVSAKTHIFQDKNCMSMFSDRFVRQAQKLLNSALSKAKDEETRMRVEDVRAQVIYLQSKRSPLKARLNGTNDELRKYVLKRKPYLRESESAEQFLKNN